MDAMTAFFRTCILVIVFVVLLVGYLILRRRKDKISRRIRRLVLVTLIAIIVVFGILRPFVFGMYIIPSSSMLPTLHDGDRVFTNKIYYWFSKPHYGDVIVFKAPPRTKPEDGEIFVKRLIGLPGDEIEISDGSVYRNGESLKEPYIYEHINYETPPITIKPGFVYVLGDNRNDSFDSSVWGPLEHELIEARATVKFWPPKRAGYIR